jgi:hypothetical protein
VRVKHHANLAFILDDLPGWEAAMLTELAAKKFTGAWIRHPRQRRLLRRLPHAWLRICRARPDLHFYAYKEVDRFRRLVEPDPPPNLLWVYSYGSLASSDCCWLLRVSTRPCCSSCCQSARTRATGRNLGAGCRRLCAL